MSRSPDDMPPALRSMWRTVRLGHRAEPRLLAVSLAMMLFTALPDALMALWLKLLADGVIDGDRSLLRWAAAGLAASTVLMWYLRVVFDRVQRRFRDRVSIALESHVAELQASVATIEHHERPEHLDRLSMLRDQVFALDHMFLSLFTTTGWLIRLAVTLVLLMTIHPVLGLLVVFAAPTVVAAAWRPAVERRVEERVASRDRLARHYFVLGTSAPPSKEVRLMGLGPTLIDQRRATWHEWYAPVAAARATTAVVHAIAWAVFGAAYVGAIVFVASGLDASAGAVLLVLAAGSRLSQYIGAAVGEIGFLRGIWLDASRRLTWLEDYAAGIDEGADLPAPDRIDRSVRFEHVSFKYPGTERLVLDDVSVELPAGSVVAIVGENGAGKTTLVKLLSRMYAPTSGTIFIDDIDLARISSRQWRERLAGAFQDFFRFEFRAITTVGLGDEPRMDERPAVTGAVGRAGADDVIDRLAHGLDTQLGPTWDAGVEVSYGQWQKLALARGFMRADPLVLVLDEPTSALDAETEHALFERYAASSRRGPEHRESRDGHDGLDDDGNGGITILVSHRFSTVRMADLIVVIDGSRVVEVGSHDELMARGGHYAELYGIQAAAYR
ncbi:MAG TPA: ABC transporter ATP-binding protein [Ilumatobacteraceae bacterium]|nr:ABC transporter ATP-binding protein [Ilumatobacteraceae bacterium]